ncbi:MAG: FG-GAP-like repeat-containing protein [Planctomycetota bacterium]
MQTGKAQYENRLPAEAAKLFKQAVELLPTDVDARLNLARSQLTSNDPTLAILQAEEALKLERGSLDGRYLAALAMLRLGKTREAIAYLEEIRRVDSTTVAVPYQLGAAYMREGDMVHAKNAFEAVLKLDADHASAHYQLAMAARRAQDEGPFQRHMAAFEKLTKDKPEAVASTEQLEQCKYTQIRIPDRPNQPNPKSIPVRFDLKKWEVENASGVLSPLALVDPDADGDWDILVVDGQKNLRLVVHDQDHYRLLDKTFGKVDLSGSAYTHPADFDNDGRTDIAIVHSGIIKLLRLAESGDYEDATQSAGLSSTPVTDVLWLDYDHDGDVDLLTLSSQEPTKLWENRGNATFADASTQLSLGSDAKGYQHAAASDLDDDGDVDIVLVGWLGKRFRGVLLQNQGLGVFAPEEKQDVWPHGNEVFIDDFDNDLRPDVLISDLDQLSMIPAVSGVPVRIPFTGCHAPKPTPIDFDNDGWLDLFVECRTANAEVSVPKFLRNIGGNRWIDVTSEVLSEPNLNISSMPVSVGDVDGDGDSDLVVSGRDGLLILRNNGGNANRQLKLRLKGTRANRDAIGSVVEIRAGTFRLSRIVHENPVEIGVATKERLESVRVLWPNGVIKHEINVDPTKPLVIEEPFVSTGSCPYLYAWDGSDFRFITDMLGGSPLGLSGRRGFYIPADTNEIVFLGDHSSFPPRDGRYAVQITDELREILYLDFVRLLAVDHPIGTEVYPLDKIRRSPEPERGVRVLRNRFAPLHVVDSAGRDLTLAVAEMDEVRASSPFLRNPQFRGLTEPFSLELEFPPVEFDGPVVLAMTGWLQWGDASVNVSAGQNPDLPDPWPRLEIWNDKQWHSLDVEVGLPAGKTKTILVELSRLPRPPGAETQRLRLTTAYEVHWDRIALCESVEDAGEIHQTRFDPVSANLFWRGFPAQIRKDRQSPIIPDPSRIESQPPWEEKPQGWCTRYGDILELITVVDDRYVIFNGGDAGIFEFGPALSDPEPGWTRSFFIELDGWDKDADYNVLYGSTVEPLPYHAQDDQKYGLSTPPETDDWIARFNTRWVAGGLCLPPIRK